MKIEGEGVYVDSKGRKHSIEGIGSLPDEINLQSIKVEGSFSFEEISCDKIKVEGECSGNTVTAKNISIEGTIEVDSVTVEDTFKLEGKAEIKLLDAKEIVMETRGGEIGEIRCDKIKIFHDEDSERRKNRSRVRIKTIDADTVNLENCEVDTIRCKDAIIGSNCAIGKLFVAGECEISADSKVDETIKGAV